MIKTDDIFTEIDKKFGEGCIRSQDLKKIADKIADGTADLTDGYKYAEQIGQILSDTLTTCIQSGIPPDEVTEEIAEKLIRPMVDQNVEMVNDTACAIQSIIDQETGIIMKPVRATYPRNRIDDLMTFLTDGDMGKMLIHMIKIQNLTQSVFDDFVRQNADVRTNSGYKAVIIRTGGYKCCKWCANLEGNYDYPKDAPKEIFRRHTNCKCSVIYKCGKTYQDVYSKEKRGSLSEITEEQEEWLRKYDTDTTLFRKNMIEEWMKEKGWTKAKAYEYFGANSRKLIRGHRSRKTYTDEELRINSLRVEYVNKMVNEKGWSWARACAAWEKNKIYLI